MDVNVIIVLYMLPRLSETFKTLRIPSTARSLRGETVYTVYTDGRTWKEARAICRQNSGHLINLETEETFQRYMEIIESSGLDIGTPWTGLYWESPTSSKWDGPFCPATKAVLKESYRFKGGFGEFSYQEKERCYRDNGFNLERRDCSESLEFICETIQEKKCNYITSGLISFTLGAYTLDVNKCITYCDQIEGCFMTSSVGFRCINVLTSDVSNRTVAIKECDTDVVLVDGEVDGVTDDDTDPTDCIPIPTTVTSSTKVDITEPPVPTNSCFNFTMTVTDVAMETSIEYSTKTESLHHNWTTTITDVVTETLHENRTVTLNNNWTVTETLNHNWTVTETANNNWTVTETAYINITEMDTSTLTLKETKIYNFTETITVSVDAGQVVEYRTSTVTETSIGVSTTTEFSVNSIVLTEVISFPVASCVTTVTETPFCESTGCNITPPCSVNVTSSTMIASQFLYSQAEIEGTIGNDGKLRKQVCQSVIVVTPNPEITQEAVESIVNELKLDRRNISALTKKKISINDQRPSSVAIGYAGLSMLMIPFLIIMVIDLPTCVNSLRNATRK